MVKTGGNTVKQDEEDLSEYTTDVSKKNKKRSISFRRRLIRTRLWPDVNDDALWLRTRSVGFTTIPRTLPTINRILDKAAGKGFPVSTTYLALWCRVFDEGFVEIRNPRDLAHESGFGGPRAEATWKNRMRLLVELGVIDAKPGVQGEFQYVLMINPLQVIAKKFADNPEDFDYRSLLDRMMQVGAEDIPY